MEEDDVVEAAAAVSFATCKHAWICLLLQLSTVNSSLFPPAFAADWHLSIW